MSDDALKRYERWRDSGRVIAADLQAERERLLAGQRRLSSVEGALEALAAGGVIPDTTPLAEVT
jgi:hypothetical protein